MCISLFFFYMGNKLLLEIRIMRVIDTVIKVVLSLNENIEDFAFMSLD